MRVLQVVDSLEIGGAEVLLKDLVPHFQHRGIDVSIALLKSTSSPLELKLKDMGVNFLPTVKDSVYSPGHIIWLARQIHHFNLIHVHLYPAQLWVAIASSLSNKEVILITTEHNTYNRRRKVWFRPLDRWMYKKYRSIACVSDATSTALKHWMPDISRRITVVPNGINLERFRISRSASKSEILHDGNCPVILSIGRFEPQKDHATILRAMAKIPSVQLILVGDGEMRHQLEQLAGSLGITNRVKFLGRRQDIPEIIKMADIYVQSSIWEGFGIAALEAMAGGLPVIASNVPGLSNIVGNAGILFQPGDHVDLATAISSLLSSPELRFKISKACMKKAEIFSIKRTADLYVDLYRKYLEG